jgi:glyoxylase-like metal-dependent hydrolase (beta-lactamase superfamily II)
MAGSTPAQTRSLTQPPALFETRLEPGRPPQQVAPGLWLFAPNRHTQGGSSWLLEGDAGLGRPDLLVDAPALTAANLAFLQHRRSLVGVDGGLIVLSHRGAHGQLPKLQPHCGWSVLVQEQEAYLLPGLTRLQTFAACHELAAGVRLLWTPGPTPGSCVLHVRSGAVDGLFCGRLLVPVAPGALAPLVTSRSFHGPRQLASLQRLITWLPEGSPGWIATAAGLGALRGQHLVMNGAALLRSLAGQGLS